MKTRHLLHWTEHDVDEILQRRLDDTPYRVHCPVPLSDVIMKDKQEWLPPEEFRMLTTSHFDFVIATKARPLTPVFAIEFDGPHHEYDADQIGRDMIKNRLCQKAGLPLLRITLSEIEEHEIITLLDYMLERWLAWPKEIQEIYDEARELTETDPEGAKWELAEWDPGFEFDLKHPFPGTRKVAQRLLHNHGIGYFGLPHKDIADAEYELAVYERSMGPARKTGYYKCVKEAVLQRTESPEDKPVFETKVQASARVWLPTSAEASDPASPWSDDSEEFQRALKAVRARWTPALPPISAWEIAEHFCDYLACKEVERWARANLKRTSDYSEP